MVEPEPPVIKAEPIEPAPKVDMVAINEMKALQKQLNDLQAEKDKLQVENDNIVKAGLLKELKVLNQLSAERNKDASIERLQIAVEEAKDLRSDLPNFERGKPGKPETNPLNVGIYDPLKNEWIE